MVSLKTINYNRQKSDEIVIFLEVAFLKATSHHITRVSSETSVKR